MNTLSEHEIADGWQLLFNGNNLGGWHGYNQHQTGEGWMADDGTLHFTGSMEGKSPDSCNDIVTDQSFRDFHLKLEWKIAPGGNSGIMFLVQEDPIYRTPWMTGPEMQLLDNEGHQDGMLEKHRAGDLYDLIAAREKSSKPAGSWNRAEIKLERADLRFVQNDVELFSTILWNGEWNALVAASKFKDMAGFAASREGRIALQDHGGAVWFRNISIKAL
jgi:hypothetical protein